MGDQFYYADANSQPVGPLTLEEIRRFAKAGVVPPDVMVCEAGGEDWRPLSAFAAPPPFATPPRTSPPLTASASRRSTDGAPPTHHDPDRIANRLPLLLCHAIVAVIFFFLLDIASRSAAAKSGGVDPNGTRAIFAGLTSLWALAAEMALVFHIFRVLPLHLRFTTPAKAAWFMLIPGFNVYWAFRLFPGLCESASAWDREAASLTGHRESAPGWLLPVAYSSAVLIAISTILALLEIVGAIPVSDGGITWIFALDHGLSFAVYIKVVSVIDGILAPLVALPEQKQNTTTWDRLFGGLGRLWTFIIAGFLIIRLLRKLKIVEF